METNVLSQAAIAYLSNLCDGASQVATNHPAVASPPVHGIAEMFVVAICVTVLLAPLMLLYWFSASLARLTTTRRN
jgi:hypothetical protein